MPVPFPAFLSCLTCLYVVYVLHEIGRLSGQHFSPSTVDSSNLRAAHVQRWDLLLSESGNRGLRSPAELTRHQESARRTLEDLEALFSCSPTLLTTGPEFTDRSGAYVDCTNVQ